MDAAKNSTPVIKGMFVNSHVKKLRSEKGDEAVKELEKRYGKPVNFKNLQDVPVREEVKIIELVLDLLDDGSATPETRAFEAGRLHFRNFTTTPYGKIMFSTIPKGSGSFKKMMMNAKYIAQHVFKNVRFESEDLGPKNVKIIMENNDYPLDHFKGLFYEWMVSFGLEGEVKAEGLTTTHYEYTLKWK